MVDDDLNRKRAGLGETATRPASGRRHCVPIILAHIDEIVAEGLRRKLMPGCVVLLAKERRVVLLKAYGSKRVKPTVEPMQTDTVFDMASITKPMAHGNQRHEVGGGREDRHQRTGGEVHS